MDFTYFWSDDCFSQWAYSPFMDQEGIVYCTAEQYMMSQKALLFKDLDTYSKIMGTKSPREQKRLGRLVTGFNKTIWDSYSLMIVYDGNVFKFSQNEELREKLLATGDSILVEASPYDAEWGIKLKKEDPRSLSISTWQGKNKLGFVLTKVRDVIKMELNQENG
ncbi:MAG: NADAR family protein [bacterium]